MATAKVIHGIKLQNNSNIVIQGCSSSGKSILCNKLLLQSGDVFITKPTQIIFCYKTWQNVYKQLQEAIPNITFLSSLPTEDELRSMVEGHSHSIFVVDDMQMEIMNKPFFSDLFTRFSHHFSTSTILLLQNAVMNSKYGGNLSKNCHYTFIMKSARDAYSIRSLGLQMGDYKNLNAAYKEATKKPYSYLLVSTHPNTEDSLRYRSDIFTPSDPNSPSICYIGGSK
jgi:hypothetical protein